MSELSKQIFEQRPRITSTHLGFLFQIFSFILTLWGFWGLETILWNRIVYSNGEWANSLPIFLETSLDTLREMILSNIVIFSIGLVGSLGASIFAFVKLLRKRQWEDNTRKLFVFQSLIAFFSSLMGFWLYNSIGVISGLPAVGSGQSGLSWLWVDIADYSRVLTSLSLVTQLIFTLTLLLSLGILYLKHEKEEKLFKQGFSLYEALLTFFKRVPYYLIIISYLVLTLVPVVMTILVSISSTTDLRVHRLPSSPVESLVKNFSSVIFAISVNEPAFATAFIYSIVLGFGTGILGLSVSLSAGYALARFKFAGNKILTFMILATQMFPGLILLIPQYVIWKDIGLLQDEVLLFGVLLAYISGAVAYCTWMMKGYFETIPLDLEEAALIDGAGRLGTFFKIAIPLAKPGMVAVLIFTFLTAWSEFVLARTFIGETAPQATLPLLFYNYQNPAAPDNPIFFELLAPYAIIVALPPVLLFLFLQKELAAGAVAGGVK
ncbi:MAG: carbohydrate ABC transporter permease [Candidatus Hodarchaeales archaeon]